MGFISRECGEEDGKFWVELRTDAPFTGAQRQIMRAVPASFSDPDDVKIVVRKDFASLLFRTIDRERFAACTPEFLEALDEAEIEASHLCGKCDRPLSAHKCDRPLSRRISATLRN